MGILKELREFLVEFKQLKVDIAELKESVVHQAAESSLESEPTEEEKKLQDKRDKETLERFHAALQGRSPILRSIRQRVRKERNETPIGVNPMHDPNLFNPFSD